MLTVTRRCFLLSGGLAAVACLSPTLPLPPPSEPEVSGPTEQGLVRLTGAAPPQSWVYALNQSTSEGIFNRATDEGRYEVVIAAQIGHRIALWYEVDGDESESIIVTVRAASE